MKIGLLGYGKMGKLIEQLAVSQGLIIAAKMSRLTDVEAIKDVDVCIDFSNAACVHEHVALAGEAGKNIVIGTTGWEDRLPAVRELVEKHSMGMLHATNFSIGANLFRLIVREAARLMDPDRKSTRLNSSH